MFRLENAPPFVYLDTSLVTKEENKSLLFNQLETIVSFRAGEDIFSFFNRLQDYLNKGFWLAGYFSYEFGHFLDAAHKNLRKNSSNNLAWVGVWRPPEEKKFQEVFSNCSRNYGLKNIKVNEEFSEYRIKIEKIKKYLEEGLTYQVNYTFKNKFDFTGNIYALCRDLRLSQPTSYSSLVNTGECKILSFSPELFFRINANKIISRPMKGTVRRDSKVKEDQRNKEWLLQSEKIKAENLMIVDLLRNDLGRISTNVFVPRLFDLESYPTVYQMTSTISAQLKRDISIKDIFEALFPCGSVTGAPKIETMRIIHELENEPRGVYTGAIGYISPQREACFNVAIRTLVISGSQGELGVGGGIVYDSNAKEEYQEALLKARFLTNRIVD